MATAGVCPHCGQLDAVRKVSSIVNEGVLVGTYQSIAPLQWQGKTYYLPVQRATTSSTLLAQKLAPPVKPDEVSRLPIIILGGILAFVLVLVLPTRDFPELLFGCSMLLIFLFVTAPLYWLFIRPREKEYAAAFARWERATERWSQLYYCARCDGVFSEGSCLVPVEQMKSLLYE